MRNFTLLRPKDLSDAFSLLRRRSDAKTYVMAGGTDLIPLLRSDVLQDDYIIDIHGLGLNDITQTADVLTIGACCTFKQIAINDAVNKHFQALAAAACSVGAVQTCGLATIGGNLCTAVPSLDSAPPLLIYNAQLKLVSEKGDRLVPVREFFTGPRKTQLKPGEEILTEIILKNPPVGFESRFTKFGRRAALTLSLVNVAFGCVLSSGKIEQASAVVGACAPTPLELTQAQEYLNDKDFSAISFDRLDELVKSAIKPITDIRASKEYRSDLAYALIRRQVRQILGKE